MCLPPWSQKILRFTVFRLLENAFVKLPPSPPSLHDLFLSPHVKHPPINFPKKFVPQRKAFFKKRKKVPILFCLFIVFYFFLFPILFLSFSVFIFFPISKSFIPKCYKLWSFRQNYTVNVSLKSYSMVTKFSKLFYAWTAKPHS